VRGEEAAGPRLELPDGVHDEEVRRRPVRGLEHLRVPRELLEGPRETEGVPGQPGGRGVREVLPLTGDRHLEDPGEERREDGEQEPDDQKDRREKKSRQQVIYGKGEMT